MDDDTLAQLFGALPEEFVGARDRIAAELARAGKKDESRELKKLRRPSPTAWATNQVVRRARAAVDGFLAASDELRARQDALLAGKGDQTAYQAGVEGLRQATAALTAAARDALEAAGRDAERSLVDGVLANLRVAAMSAERRRELLEGHLTADLEPADDGLAALGLSAGMPVAPPRATPRPAASAPGPAAGGAKQARADEHREKERREAEEKARALAEVRREEDVARANAAGADAAAREATARREQARARLDEAEQAVTDAREALRQAEAAQRETAREQATADGAARAATRRREAVERG